MNTSLAHLSSLQRQQLETAIRIVVQAVRPEKIILFGVYSVEAEAVLFTERVPPGIGAYDLLVVTREGDRRSDYELQDIIENRCRDEVPVTVLVHDIGYVNRRIAEGHYFFSTIRREAILLYDGDRTPLAEAGLSDLVQVRLTAERDFDRWRRQAWAFFKSAEFNIGREEWKIATFLLHQAAEHMYQAILLAFTGYKPTTHNLDKLRRYTNRFSIELALLFPRNSEEEDRVFRLLLSGYVDARYKEDFFVTGAEAGLLAERVGKLLEIAERVCRNRLLSLEKKISRL
jgi:HEPN domain-containing protein